MGLDHAHVAEVILAHEIGHRVQELLGTSVPPPPFGGMTPETKRREELDADAFAGAYIDWLAGNGQLSLGMIRAGELSRKYSGDDYSNTPRNSLSTHGTSHERMAAFMTGVQLGLPDDFCRTGIAVR